MIPISKPLIGDEEKAMVLRVLESGHLAQGAMVVELERALARFCGVAYATAVSSGTAALHVALLAHGIGPGDEVITTPFSFIASANAISFVGAYPVFVDIEPDTFNLDVEQVEAAITPRTRAILPVHLFGHPCDMEAILDIARRRGLAVIEDAAQAVGAAINGRRVGSFGTGCFSLYATKNITTGEGGMITTDDPILADSCRLIRDHGMRYRYQHEVLGHNFRMSDIHAALGVAQVGKLDHFMAQRLANASYLSQNLRGVVVPRVKTGYTHVFHQYTIRVPGKRDAAVARLASRGVGTGIFYPRPIHHQEVYRRLGYGHLCYAVAEQASAEVLSLPVYPALSREDLERVVQEVNNL